MEVRLGYQHTAVGVLPSQWDVKTIEAMCCSVLDCDHSTPVWTDSGAFVIRNQNIRDGRLDLAKPSFTNDEHFARRTRRAVPRFGDLVITREAPIGLVCMIPKGVRCCLGQRMVLLRVDSEVADVEYLLFALLSETAQRAILIAGGTGSTVANLRIPSLKALEIPAPSIEEQRAIASALSDVDALLDGLTQLIAKKRDLKQALMQQLLTGQTRLTGFDGEWEVRRLGDHVRFLNHGVNSRAELTSEGRVKYLHYGDIHACAAVFLSPHALPSLPADKAASLERLRNGDLVFADASEDLSGVSKSVEMRDVGSVELVAGQHTIAARFDQALFADGFKAYLQFCEPFASHLRRLAAGTKVYATNRAHIASVKMKVPAPEEQTAITQVLDDMGAEIRAIESRREKTVALKRAMMQELLTGKTRLV